MTTSTDDNMFDETNRPFLLAASKYRAKLQKSDTEDLLSIARRLRTQFEAKKADDAADAQKPPATLSDTDRLALHRPGWRTDARPKNGEDEDNSWEHDRRKKQSTKHVRSDDPTKSEEALSDARRKKYQQYNERGQEAGSIVEEEDDPERSERDSDCNEAEKARAEYKDWVGSQWKTGR